MDNIKLIIPQKKYTGETSIVSMRIPKDMLKDIEWSEDGTYTPQGKHTPIEFFNKAAGRTRNEILQMSLEFALNHMSIENK